MDAERAREARVPLATSGAAEPVQAAPRAYGCSRLAVLGAALLAVAGVAGVAVAELGASARLTAHFGRLAAPWQCKSSLDFGELLGRGAPIAGIVKADQKGLAVDDTTYQHCTSKIPGLWPNAKTNLSSLRLFKAWDPNWPDDQREGERPSLRSRIARTASEAAWKALKATVEASDAKVLVGTQVTCNETEDDQDWSQVLKLLQILGRDHVMGVAVGNEMELLQFKNPKLVPPDCIKNIWPGGYFYRKLTDRVADLKTLATFEDVTKSQVPITSVFGGYIMAGSPFVNTPGAMVLSFLKNVTKDLGTRWVYTLQLRKRWAAVFRNVYPYFDPGNRLDVNSTTTCKESLKKALCMEPDCLLPATTAALRQRMKLLSGSQEDKLWLGETGWSYPQIRARAQADYSSLAMSLAMHAPILPISMKELQANETLDMDRQPKDVNTPPVSPTLLQTRFRTPERNFLLPVEEFNEDANLEKAPKEVALEKSIASPQVQSTEREKRIDSPSGFALEEVQLDKEQAIALQEAMMTAFNAPLFQRQLHEKQSNADFRRNRVQLVRKTQLAVIASFGFPGTLEGVEQMLRAFRTFKEDPDIQVNEAAISALLSPQETEESSNWAQACTKPSNKLRVMELLRKLLKEFSAAAFQVEVEELKRVANYNSRRVFDVKLGDVNFEDPEGYFELEGREDLVLATQSSVLSSFGFHGEGLQAVLQHCAPFFRDPEVAELLDSVNAKLGMSPSACRRFRAATKDP
ncbi:unnamed protein product [Effrenium voratum]|nr:unnamed protein product [Effrenium voratum]